MEFNLLYWFVALLPIAFLLFLISYLEISSRLAAGLSLILASLLALNFFQITPYQLSISTGKGAVLSLYVILIIVGAVLLYNIVDTAGGFESMKVYINSLGGDKTLKLLALSWAFSSFIQGITGFGVPVAIVGALLAGIGYKPMIALITVLIGHSWAISFGSMGSSFYALQLVTGLEALRLGTTMALLFLIPILTTGIFTAYVYNGLKAVKNQLKYIFPVGLVMGFMLWAAAFLGFPHIGSLLAGMSGSALFLVILLYRTEHDSKDAQNISGVMPLKHALFPYFLLIISVLIAQIPPVAEFLPEWELAFSFPGYTTGLGFEVSSEPNFSPIGFFTHPFFFLILASTAGIILYSSKKFLRPGEIKEIIKDSLNRASSSVMTVFLLMILASLMNDSGMVSMFARGMARLGGDIFPILSPVIGILGAFLTGSNTSSNVLFGAFQVDSAGLLNLSPYMIASTQSIGGSLGSAVAPAKIIMGTAIVGMEGAEGDILKRCLGFTLISGILVGLAVLGLHQIF